MKPSIVYVSIGKQIDTQLVDHAIFAHIQLKECNFYLITDKVNSYRKFPGHVISYEQSIRSRKTMNKLFKSKGILKYKARGYWFKTFERLLALDIVLRESEISYPVIHIENDILFFGNYRHLCTLSRHISKATAVRWSTMGNCGMLYLPDINSLSGFLDKLHAEALVESLNDSWSIDQPIIGRLLDQQSLDFLPGILNTSKKPSNTFADKIISFGDCRLIGDSGDLGTYLFGRNAIYSGGVITSGYVHKHIMWPIDQSKWLLTVGEDGESFRLQMSLEDEIFEVLFLHISSKINLAKGGGRELLNFMPPGEWLDRPIFPEGGYLVNSVHKDSYHSKALQVLLKIKSKFLGVW